MKAVLQSELAYIGPFSAVILAIFAIMYVVFCWLLQSPMIAPVLCVVGPLSAMFGFMDADVDNGWRRYRAALPFSRRDLVFGRYAVVLLSAVASIALAFALAMVGNAVGPVVVSEFDVMPAFELLATCICITAAMLMFVAFAQPLMVKFGNTKGMSVAILAFLLVFALVVAILSQAQDASILYAMGGWVEANLGLMLAAICVVDAIALAISCAASLRIYQRKDL